MFTHEHLALHPRPDAWVTVDRAVSSALQIGRIRSTGHDVRLTEAEHASFVFPVAGQIRTVTTMSNIRVAQGEGFLAGRGTRDTHVEPAPAQGEFHGVAILIRPETPQFHRLLSDNEALHFTAQGSRTMIQALDFARVLYDCAENGTGLLSRRSVADSWSALLQELLLDTLREMRDGLPSSDGSRTGAARYVQQAEDYMHANFGEIGTIADVATHVGVSLRTLEIAFRRVRETSPGRRLAEIRLAEARRLLRSPDGPDSVTNVCLDCGIGHAGRFASAYRQAFGETPSETLARRR